MGMVADMFLWLRVSEKICGWLHDRNADFYYTTLKRLLGKEGAFHISMADIFTEEDRQTCLKLDGPHGLTFFKIICHQRGLIDLLEKCEGVGHG